jgi:hypothetical protein
MKKSMTIDQPSFLTPRPNVKDRFKVYERPFLGNKQFDSRQTHGSERTIHIDPEVIYRLATLGLDRASVAGFWGISKSKYAELCDEYPMLEEVYLMGATAGLVKAAQSLEEMVGEKQLVPVLFRLKVGGFIEAEKRLGKESNDESAPKVQVFLPSNGREVIDMEDEV